MARVNGVNSDYQLINGTIQEVSSEPAELYMKIFICPYRQPNALEPLNGASRRCEGIDSLCPKGDKGDGALGHAMIQLHQGEGIKLITDKDNRLVLDQEGNIRLSPSINGKAEVNGAFVIKRKSGEEVLLDVSLNKISLQVDGGPKIHIDGNRVQVIKQSSPKKVIVDITEDDITLEADSGAKVSLKQNGDIDLHTKANSGTVTIHGNLHVTGKTI